MAANSAGTLQLEDAPPELEEPPPLLLESPELDPARLTLPPLLGPLELVLDPELPPDPELLAVPEAPLEPELVVPELPAGPGPPLLGFDRDPPDPSTGSVRPPHPGAKTTTTARAIRHQALLLDLAAGRVTAEQAYRIAVITPPDRRDDRTANRSLSMVVATLFAVLAGRGGRVEAGLVVRTEPMPNHSDDRRIVHDRRRRSDEFALFGNARRSRARRLPR